MENKTITLEFKDADVIPVGELSNLFFRLNNIYNIIYFSKKEP